MATLPGDARPSALSGFNRDIACPTCGYNLRGLTVARCPECGNGFDPRELRLRREQHGPGALWSILVVTIYVGLVLVPLMAAARPLLILVVIVAVIFAVSAAQAALEISLARWLVGEITGPRFRTWWEGVLIGYGVCSVTMSLSGWCVSYLEWGQGTAWPSSFARVFALTCVEALAIQFWVVRRRWRQWNQPADSWRLLGACLLAKAAAEAVWWLLPLRIMPFET